MKVVILAGGKGTRISEESAVRPKPLIEIGGWPLIWHVMKIYSNFGFDEFIVCLGYRGYMIKEYFSNYFLHLSDVTFDLATNSFEVHQHHAEKWRVTLVDTGEETQTGGRLKRVQNYLEGEACFALTYGDGVANVDLDQLVQFHRLHQKYATVTAVQPAMRFGALQLGDENEVMSFHEKAVEGGGWINGGFFILSPAVFEYIDGDHSAWEGPPLEMLAKERQLRAFKHNNFWHPVDTLRDKNYLEDLWRQGCAPWKTWD